MKFVFKLLSSLALLLMIVLFQNCSNDDETSQSKENDRIEEQLELLGFVRIPDSKIEGEKCIELKSEKEALSFIERIKLCQQKSSGCVKISRKKIQKQADGTYRIQFKIPSGNKELPQLKTRTVEEFKELYHNADYTSRYIDITVEDDSGDGYWDITHLDARVETNNGGTLVSYECDHDVVSRADRVKFKVAAMLRLNTRWRTVWSYNTIECIHYTLEITKYLDGDVDALLRWGDPCHCSY